MNKYDKRMMQLTLFGDNNEDLQQQILQNIVHVTDQELDEAECTIGYTFPVDYREFLRDYGGVFVGSGILVHEVEKNTSCYCDVTTLYGVNTKQPFYNLVFQYRNVGHYFRDFPSHLLPISSTESAPCIAVMSLADKDRGAIYCYGDTEDEQGTCLLARSFDEFLSLIDPREDSLRETNPA